MPNRIARGPDGKPLANERGEAGAERGGSRQAARGAEGWAGVNGGGRSRLPELIDRSRRLFPPLLAMSVVPPNRSQTGWPRGVNQFGNKYIQQTKPLTLERTINL